MTLKATTAKSLERLKRQIRRHNESTEESEGQLRDLTQAISSAIEEAETNGVKRRLKQFKD